MTWFRLAILGIFLVSLGLRFWQLGQFNTLVFDEVYYAKFANYYLIGKDFFNSHPPLSQYLIALGIWVGSHFPTSPDTINNLTGSMRSTISYRWLNALTGSFFPLVVGAIAYQLTQRRSYTVVATFLAATDGLFLVESRYALNNIYLVLFGLLGQLFFLLYLNQNKNLYLTIGGIFFGASIAVKWNGLGFLTGIYILIFAYYLYRITNYFISFLEKRQNSQQLIVIENLKITKLLFLFFNLLIIPFFTYSILWLPHLMMNPKYGWVEVHQKIWDFHHKIGDTAEVHHYCSKWYTWFLMIRPIAYFYERNNSPSGTIIHDVHAMGNPILWMLATGAIFSILFIFILRLFKLNQSHLRHQILFLYILVNYWINLLPWIGVSRCTFLYHYMASYVYSWFALTWIIEQCLMIQSIRYRSLGLVLLNLIIIAFIFWLPIYLGIPLSQQSYNMRMLLHNWI